MLLVIYKIDIFISLVCTYLNKYITLNILGVVVINKPQKLINYYNYSIYINLFQFL